MTIKNDIRVEIHPVRGLLDQRKIIVKKGDVIEAVWTMPMKMVEGLRGGRPSPYQDRLQAIAVG